MLSIGGKSGKKRPRRGAFVPSEREKVETTRITVMDYDGDSFQTKEIEKIEECFHFREKPSVTWINIDGVHDAALFERLGDCYGFHPLVLEDIMHTEQRPKMEDYGDYVYVVLKMLYSIAGSVGVTAEQVSLIVGSNFVISFQEGTDGDVFGAVRDRIKNDKSRLRKMGADYLLYSLIDAIVDNYFSIIEELGERVEFLEDRLISNPAEDTLQEIHSLKREMIFLRKAVWPLREVISSLERGESALIAEPTRLYFRDVYDHTIQVIDTVETLRDMVAGMLDIYLSSVSNRMNAVMKVLTIIATIFMPLTFLAGVYGMNFKHMPELEWSFGYPALWLIMLTIAALMVYYFKKKRWI